MKILHTADVHLESSLESVLPEREARERRAEIAATFERALEYAHREGVRAVVIAGDLYDKRRVSKKALLFLSGLLDKYSDITFFYAGGNHDAGFSAGADLPANFIEFGRTWGYKKVDGVCFAGLTLDKNNCADYGDTLVLEERDYNIVILHGKLAAGGGANTIDLRALSGKHIDYLALGDSHSFLSQPLDGRGRAVYPGCLEGRGYDEVGTKGFMLLDTEKNSCDFIPFAARTVREIEVDVTGAEDYAAQTAALDRASQGAQKGDIVKFLLRGTKTTDTVIDVTALAKYAEGRFFAAKVKDLTTLKIHARDYENDVSLKGEFVRLLLSSELNREEKSDAVLLGIKALRGEELEL